MLRLELETNADVALRVGDVEVLRAPASATAVHAHELELAPGAHPVVVMLTAPAQRSAYLRVRTLDLNGPRPWGMHPIDLDDWTTTPSEVRSARGAGRTIVFALALGIALVAGWAALRRPKSVPPWLVDASVIVSACALYFVPRAVSAGFSVDELAYVKAGENYVSNLLLGDFATTAWRWNMEHPPVAKWVYGWGALLGGFEGARATAALCGALTVALVGLTGRVLFSRAVGLVAAALLATTPHFVALVRTCTLEAVTLVLWAALLLVLACWMRQAGLTGVAPRPPHAPSERALRTAAGALVVLGTLARATSVWSGALVIIVAAALARRRRTGGLWVPWETVLGATLAALFVYAGWAWLWPDPRAQFGEAVRHFTDYVPFEWYRGELVHPPRDYFARAFLATTPDLHLVAGIAGALVLVRRAPTLALFLVAATLLPFCQSVSHVRQDLSRYVVTAWLGLALLGALALDALGAVLARRAGRPLVRFAPALVVVGIALGGLAYAEPYPRTFFALWTGGAPRVARSRAFEVADWCEGLEDATEFVNAHAAPGDRVEYRTSCRDLHHALRDDLHEHRGRGARWVISQRGAYELDGHEDALAACEVAHDTRASGVVIARAWDCARSD